MDRGSIIVLSLGVVAVGLAVTGQLTRAHAAPMVSSRTLDADVDLAHAKRLVIRSGSTDVHLTTASGPPGAHVRLDVRGNHVEAVGIHVTREGDAAIVSIAENRPQRGWMMISMTSAVVVRGRVDVEVSTGSGDVTADGMPRTVDAHAGSGDVKITAPHGSVTAGTGSGDVTLALDGAFAGSAVTLTTGSGDVDVSVPAGFHAALRTHTNAGNVTDDAHVAPAASPELSLRTGSGDIHIATP